MKNNVLIIGNGRAGKRHKKHATYLGLDAKTVDPFVDADFRGDWRSALYDHKWDYVVIATPPQQHFNQIMACIDYGAPIMCEKPLVDVGQIGLARMLPKEAPVLVSYNWVYNYGIVRFDRNKARLYKLFAEQARELPVWGLASDHLGHDLSIIMELGHGIDRIDFAEHHKDAVYEAYHIEGATMDDKRFVIDERVYRPEHEVPRSAKVNDINLVATDDMFLDMWQDFLSGKYYPGIKRALEIQEHMESVVRMAVEV